MAPGLGSVLTVRFGSNRKMAGTAPVGIHATERNIANKVRPGEFTGAFLNQCLLTIGATRLQLDALS